MADAKGNQRESYRDVRRLITAVREYVEDEDGILQPIDTHYVYDALKQITDVWDAANNHTFVDYDRLGRRTVIDNPDTGKVEYEFNLNGDLRYKTTPNLRKVGKKIEYRYDRDRLVEIVYPTTPENNVRYTYGEDRVKQRQP